MLVEKPDNFTQHWLGIIDSMAMGFAFLVISTSLVKFLRSRCVGHRLLMVTGLICCLIRSVANFIWAWEIYVYRPHRWHVAIYAVAAFSWFFFAVYFMVCDDDILTTLRTSEAEDRLRRDRADDALQVRLNLEYINSTNLHKSMELVRQQREGV